MRSSRRSRTRASSGPEEGGLAFALLFAAIPAGAVVGGVFSGWVSRVSAHGRAVIVCILVWGLSMVGFGVAVGLRRRRGGWQRPMLVVAVLMLVVGGAADMASAAFRMSMLQSAASDEVRGRLQGIFIVVVAGGPRVADVAARSVRGDGRYGDGRGRRRLLVVRADGRRRARGAVVRALPGRQQPTGVAGLAEVLRVVVEHADQPGAERDRRVPAVVDDPVEVVVAEAGEVVGGLLVDCCGVLDQQLRRSPGPGRPPRCSGRSRSPRGRTAGRTGPRSPARSTPARRPATSATWSSCTRSRCQTSQAMVLASAAGRWARSSSDSPSTTRRYPVQRSAGRRR